MHVSSEAYANLKRATSAALDVLLPPRCLLCRERVTTQGSLCAACFAPIRFIVAPFCAVCGLPLEVDMGQGALCGGCVREHPAYVAARSVCLYDEHGRRLVTHLKYGDGTHLAGPCGRWMARAGEAMLAASDVLVPVPLHRWRLLSRRFNQSLLLAREISHASGLPMLADGLLRRKRTPPQASLTRRQRLLNVRGAFAVTPKRQEALAGKKIVLVDDVMTTGATIDACVRALYTAGADAVSVLTFARTP